MEIDEKKSQERIEEIFESARLGEEDRNLWRGRLSSAGNAFRSVFIDVFGDDRDALTFFTGDLRKRLEAGSDRKRLDDIEREERDYFSSILRRTEQERI